MPFWLNFHYFHVLSPDLWVRRGKLSLMREIDVFSPQAWNSRITHESWQVYYRGRLLATYWQAITCICRIRHLHIFHNAPYLPPEFCITVFFTSPGYDSRSKRNWKQCLCKIWGGGVEGANKAHYGKCASGVRAVLWLTFWVAYSTVNSRSLLILLNTIAGA